MNRKYGIVLVGCGHMGAAHLNDIYFRDNIEIRGVVDIEADRAREFAKKYCAASWDTDYRKYLRDASAHIFIITTYPDTHLPILRDCLKHNKHVLCEKPIATTIEEADEFVSLVKRAESKVLVGHILRHNKTYNLVARMIRNGAIGSPMVIRMVQNHHTKNWDRYLELIRNSSPIVDCGVHYIDIMQWFTGSKVSSVSGIGARTEPDVPYDRYNYGMICLKFEDGSVAYYEAGWGNTIAAENIKEFIGPRGRIRITYRRDRLSNKEEGDLVEYYTYPENEYKIINVDSDRKPTWEQLQHLIKMIEDGVEALPSIDEVYEAFRIAMISDEAIKTGRTIDISRQPVFASCY